MPERNFAIAILTNANTGWRLIQDVEREALKTLPRRDVTRPIRRSRIAGSSRRCPRSSRWRNSPIPRRTSAPTCGRAIRSSCAPRGNSLFVQDRPNTGKPGRRDAGGVLSGRIAPWCSTDPIVASRSSSCATPPDASTGCASSAALPYGAPVQVQGLDDCDMRRLVAVRRSCLCLGGRDAHRAAQPASSRIRTSPGSGPQCQRSTNSSSSTTCCCIRSSSRRPDDRAIARRRIPSTIGSGLAPGTRASSRIRFRRTSRRPNGSGSSRRSIDGWRSRRSCSCRARRRAAIWNITRDPAPRHSGEPVLQRGGAGAARRDRADEPRRNRAHRASTPSRTSSATPLASGTSTTIRSRSVTSRSIFDNVAENARGNFNDHHRHPLVGEYDFGSIMHYARNAFAIDATRPRSCRMRPINPGHAHGNAARPSDLDHAAMAFLYNAQLRESTIRTPTESRALAIRSRRPAAGDGTAARVLHEPLRVATAAGLSINGRPDFLGIAQWIFDIYLGARSGGFSAEGAFDIVIAAITRSDEWRQKNPGRMPLTPSSFQPFISFNRDEFLDVLNRLDSSIAPPEGLQRADGLSIAGGPDFLGHRRLGVRHLPERATARDVVRPPHGSCSRTPSARQTSGGGSTELRHMEKLPRVRTAPPSTCLLRVVAGFLFFQHGLPSSLAGSAVKVQSS